MAEPLKPPPIEEDRLSVDNFSSDFDASLKADTAAARAKPLSDFPGAQPTEAESSAVEVSGGVDDDALRAAVVASAVEKPEVVGDTAVSDPYREPTPEPPASPAQPTEPTKPATTKPEATKPEPAKPAAAERPKYDPAEQFGITDGISLTREQIIQGLRERNASVQTAQTFQSIFRCTPQQAEQYWKPYVDRLVGTPALGDWIDQSIATFDDPEKKKYLDKCYEFYDAERGSQPAARPVIQPAAIPPDVRRELDAAKEFRERTERQNIEAYVKQERDALTQQYPQLADPAVYEMVRARTELILIQQEKAGVPMTYRLTDAVRDLKPTLERLALPPQPGARPELKAVPALNTSSGASASTKPQVDMKPRKFASPDDALADWDKNVAPALGFK
jgi:hypothetical protein